MKRSAVARVKTSATGREDSERLCGSVIFLWLQRLFSFIRWSILYRFHSQTSACFYRPKHQFKAAGPSIGYLTGTHPGCRVIGVPKERTMADIAYVQQLRKTISGHFYFGVMCRETRRRIAISPDTSGGKQRYSHAGETIVSCNHCHKTHRFDNRDIFSFAQVGWE